MTGTNRFPFGFLHLGENEMPKRRRKVENYRGPAALEMIRAGLAARAPLCCCWWGTERVPPVPGHDPLPAPLDIGLSVSGWMLLGMQVAPATVAMENNSVAKFPAIFMCPSLSSRESLVYGEPGMAGSTRAGCCRGLAVPGFLQLFLLDMV